MAFSLGDMLGQDDAVKRLAKEFSGNRTAHAYLLEGPAGCGKLTMARGIAARRFCLEPDTETGFACGRCRPCLLLQHGNHPDYLEMPREQAELRIGRFVERSTGTETVEHQPLLSFLRLKPVEGQWRVAVIPDADRMRQESANAFLKTLEEPPGNALIVLTTNARDRLPATISSRCRRIGVRPLPAERIAAELIQHLGIPEEQARTVAIAAEGSLGSARDMTGGDLSELWTWLETEAFSAPGAAAAKRLADAWLDYGGEGAGKRQAALQALNITALVLRRLVRSGLDPEKGAAALDALWIIAEQLERNVRPDVALLGGAFQIMSALR